MRSLSGRHSLLRQEIAFGGKERKEEERVEGRNGASKLSPALHEARDLLDLGASIYSEVDICQALVRQDLRDAHTAGTRT